MSDGSILKEGIKASGAWGTGDDGVCIFRDEMASHPKNL